VQISGFNNNVSVADGDYKDHRNYFFALPVAEAEFVTYVNREHDDWDYVADRVVHLENQMDIKLFMDNEPFTPPVDAGVILEIEFQ
jgi:hypothetical protein